MRIWDIAPGKLCRKHLLGEHVELHALWTILTEDRQGGWANHPEARRWRGRLRALYNLHGEIVAEMARRGYRHNTPLDEALATGESTQTEVWQPVDEQIAILRQRCGECDV